MRFGERVRQLRKEKGMTQEELTKAIGASSKSMICKIENGTRMTPLSMVSKIAAALGVSISDLTEEKEDPENIALEFVPYLNKAEEWQLEAVRKILEMPPKKIYQSTKISV